MSHSLTEPPTASVQDADVMDVTDNLVHGNQEEVFFNPYYGGYCYAPLYIFCGKHLLAAKLRASNVDPALMWIRRVTKSDKNNTFALE